MISRHSPNEFRSGARQGERFAASVVWILSGAVIGTVALVIDLSIDAIALAVFQWLLATEACVQGFSDATIVAMLGVAIGSSLFVGCWIFRMRRWVGTKVDDENADWGAHLRARFITGAMLVFVTASPFKWALVLSWANCYGD